MGQDYKTPQNSWFGTPEEQLDAPAPGSDTPTMDNTAAQAKLASQTPANDPSTPLLHALTGGGDDGQAEGGFSWTQPLAEDPGPAVPPFQESWWFGGLDEVGLDPIETEGSARLPEQDGSRPGVPGADPNRDSIRRDGIFDGTSFSSSGKSMPCFWTCYRRHHDCARVLLALGATPDHSTEMGSWNAYKCTCPRDIARR